MKAWLTRTQVSLNQCACVVHMSGTGVKYFISLNLFSQ